MTESPWIVRHSEETRFHTRVVRRTGGVYEYLQMDGTVQLTPIEGWFDSVKHAEQVIAEYESNKEQHNDRIK